MFITFEGIEGSGKTTQIPHVSEFLKNRGHDCVVTREPGSTRIGQKIRAILLDPENKDMDPLAELLLYMADRAQHIREVIRPALSEGRMVLCDRYYDATVVYQGAARGIGADLIRKLHQQVLDDLKPDLTFLLDLPPEMGLSRAWNQIETGNRAPRETRFEEEQLAFHEKVRAGYLALAKHEPERFRIIDASMNEIQVRDSITAMLDSKIRDRI